MNKERFIEIIKTHVVPDALSKTRAFSTRITIQVDSAGAHGGGRTALETNTFPVLRAWVDGLTPRERRQLWPTNRPFPIIDFVAQPARSPDLNVLDLGAWRSLEIAAGSGSLGGFDWATRLRERVVLAWDQWCQHHENISCLFRKLEHVARAIVTVDEDNNFLMPHERDR